MNVSVRELKNNLSKYLRRVQRHGEVVVTSHGKPVARLSPVSEAETEVPVAERLRRLPWVVPGSGDKPRGAGRPIRIRPGDKPLSEVALEDRG